MQFYINQVTSRCPTPEFLEELYDLRAAMQKWRDDHVDRVRYPD